MGRFKNGSKLVCINAPIYLANQGRTHMPIPSKGEVVTADGYNKFGSLLLVEYCGFVIDGRQSFDDYDFRLAISDAVLEKELESIPETQTV